MKNPAHDPFGEQERAQYRMLVDVLGIRVRVRSNSRRLLRILEQAFGALPAHRFASRAQQAELTLLLRDGPTPSRITTPEPMRMHSGAGVLLGILDANNLVTISVEQRRALLCVNRAMLGFPYHLRYELMEFALYTLAPRMQRLLPLHAACVGLRGRGLLLSGDSGSGKSTAGLMCAADGFELLSEDAVFVEPTSLRATGCANFLHVRAETVKFVDDARLRERIRRAPVIVRRGGARKFELDVRTSGLAAAARPLRLAALIVLSAQRARDGQLLSPLRRAEALAELTRAQPYAASDPQWNTFCDRMLALPAYRLLRGAHPAAAALALRSLLDSRDA